MDELINACNQQYILSGKVVLFCMILPIGIALVKWPQQNKILKLFFFFCVATLLLNCLEFAYLYAANNYTSYFEHWFIITDNSLNFFLILHQLKNFLFLGWFFNLLLKAHGFGRWVWPSSLILSFAAIVAYIIEEGWKNYGTFGPTAEAIFLFFIPLFYLWFLSRTSLGVPLIKNPYFLISLGLAIPNLIGLFLYFFADPIRASDFCLFARLAIAKNCFEILGQVLFAVAFWRARFARYVMPSKSF